MWCPSATLSVWANAWLAGLAAPDDVLDALSCWAPAQSVAARDAVAAGTSGLPWPAEPRYGALPVLETVSSVAGRSTGWWLQLVLPIAGDVRGLPAGTAFARQALGAGEAVIAASEREVFGLVPEPAPIDSVAETVDHRVGGHPLRWSVHALPRVQPVVDGELGSAEYALRSAVRSAATLLAETGPVGGDCTDPRAMVEELVESARRHRIPDHAPSRAVRLLESAACVDAIITVCRDGGFAQTLSAHQDAVAGDTLRSLAATVRAARMAAVTAILRSARSA